MATIKFHPAVTTWKPLSKSVENALSGTIRGVRSFDVGQGDCNAVMANGAAGRFAALLLDVGGGCGRCARTYPGHRHACQRESVTPPDISESPKVMLSHWDKDHYYSAVTTPAITRLEWLVPRQKIGPRCSRLVLQISRIACFPRNRRAHRYHLTRHEDLYAENVGELTRAKRSKDKNLSGLAFTLIRHDGQGNDEQRIIMTADAPYQYVASLNGRSKRRPGGDVRGLFAFHHGSKTHLDDDTRKAIPAPGSSTRHRVVFTYGLSYDAKNRNSRNNFGHPAPEAVEFYRENDWEARGNTASEQPNDTSHATDGHNCRTAGSRDIDFT